MLHDRAAICLAERVVRTALDHERPTARPSPGVRGTPARPERAPPRTGATYTARKHDLWDQAPAGRFVDYHGRECGDRVVIVLLEENYSAHQRIQHPAAQRAAFTAVFAADNIAPPLQLAAPTRLGGEHRKQRLCASALRSRGRSRRAGPARVRGCAHQHGTGILATRHWHGHSMPSASIGSFSQTYASLSRRTYIARTARCFSGQDRCLHRRRLPLNVCPRC